MEYSYSNGAVEKSNLEEIPQALPFCPSWLLFHPTLPSLVWCPWYRGAEHLRSRGVPAARDHRRAFPFEFATLGT